MYAPSSLARAVFSRFASEIDDLRRELRIPALSAAIVEDRALAWAQGFGSADLARAVPATPHTPYHLASVTKPLAAVVLMQLVEKGVVGLEDPASRWGLRLGSGVRVWNLLSHTSAGTAGGAFQYDGSRYALLDSIIASASGLPFAERLYRGILKPLGMRETAPNAALGWESFLVSLGLGERRRDYARVYTRMARPYRITSKLGVAPGAYPTETTSSAGVISSVLDLAKLDVALDSGALMRPESRERMWAPVASTSGNDSSLWYGLGWFVQYCYGVRLVWHYGIWPPSASALWLKAPEERLSLILLANTDGLSTPFPLGEGDVLVSAFALAFARTFIYPRYDATPLPDIDWRAPEAELIDRLGQLMDPYARDLLERELWSRRQLFAAAGRWDLAGRLERVRQAAFPESVRASDARFASVWGGFWPAPPRALGPWGVVRAGRLAAAWLVLVAASVLFLIIGAVMGPPGRLVAWPRRLPAAVVFGPLGLLSLLGERRAELRAAFTGLDEALEIVSWYALALAASVALVSGHAQPRALIAVVPLAYGAALLLRLLVRRGSADGSRRGWYLAALRSSILPAAVSTNVVSAGTSLGYVFLVHRWFGGTPDAGSPLLWVAIPAAAMGGLALIVPFLSWLSPRGGRLSGASPWIALPCSLLLAASSAALAFALLR